MNFCIRKKNRTGKLSVPLIYETFDYWQNKLGIKKKLKEKKENQIRQCCAEFYATNKAKEWIKRSRKVWRKCLIIQAPSSKGKNNILLFFCLIYAVPGFALVCCSSDATARKIAR